MFFNKKETNLLTNSPSPQLPPTLQDSLVLDYQTYITVLADTYNKGKDSAKYFSPILIPFYFNSEKFAQSKSKITGKATFTIPGIHFDATRISILTLQTPSKSGVSYPEPSALPLSGEISIHTDNFDIRLTVTVSGHSAESPPDYLFISLELTLDITPLDSTTARVVDGGICIVLETQDPAQSFEAIPGPEIRWEQIAIGGACPVPIQQKEQHLFIFPAASWDGTLPAL